MKELLRQLRKQPPIVITLIFLSGAIIITSIALKITDVLHLILSPILLPSILSSIGLYQGQVIMKRNAKKDANDIFLRKDIYAQLEQLKVREQKLEEELVSMKERILRLEIMVFKDEDSANINN